jgi:hypothetical protein
VLILRFSLKRPSKNFLYWNDKGTAKLVYYESIKRELKIRSTYDCRCDERLKTKDEDSRSVHSSYTLGCTCRKNSTPSIGSHDKEGVTRPGQTHQTPKDLSAHTVYIRARGGWGRGGFGLRSAVSVLWVRYQIFLLFIIRVKREVKRVYRNGCRYNERLNSETGGSKTPRTHWVVRVNI